MDTIKKVQIAFLVIVLNFCFVFSSYANISKSCSDLFKDRDRLEAVAIKDLRDPDLRVRSRAITILDEINPKSPEAYSALAKTLEDSNIEMRLDAAWLLSQVEPKSPEVQSALAKKALQGDTHWSVRFYVNQALSKVKIE